MTLRDTHSTGEKCVPDQKIAFRSTIIIFFASINSTDVHSIYPVSRKRAALQGSRTSSTSWDVATPFVESRIAYLARFNDGIKARDLVVMCFRA